MFCSLNLESWIFKFQWNLKLIETIIGEEKEEWFSIGLEMHATLFESTIISRLNYIGLENLQKYSGF